MESASQQLDLLHNLGPKLLSEDLEEGAMCVEEEYGPNVVLFAFCMLLLGLLTTDFLKKLPFPYTALLLIIGLVMGLIHKEASGLRHNAAAVEERDENHTAEDYPIEAHYWRQGYERLGIGVELWEGIGPELLLLIFLPALIFSSAFHLDFHILSRVCGQALLLAGPGVLIGTTMVAVFAKYVFPYGWCWPKAFLFGSMMSATDPVAVVALLKDVGASAKLGHVIEGEALFNDGTAFVFFLIFRDMIPATGSCLDDADDGGFQPQCKLVDRSMWESIGFFMQLALGGPAVGIACGIVATLWIKCVFSNLYLEISLTFVTAYLTFYLAEDILGVSGVLAVVAFGIFMGTFAKDRVSSKVHQAMHVFWQMLEYFANTMIFIFTGLKIAVRIYEENHVHINPQDWGWAILLYLALNAIRGLTVLILFPLLTRMGYGLTIKDSIVMVWGGLRGAIGLALAIIVELDKDMLPPGFRALVMFHMGVTVIFTLIINGSTMPYLLSYLGTTKTSPEKLEVLLHVVKDLEDVDITKLEFDAVLGDVDTEKVMSIATVDVDKILPKKQEVCQVIADAMEKQNPAIVGLGDELSPQDLSRLHPTPDGYKHEMEDNHHHSTLVTVPPMSRRSHDIQKWGIGDFHAVKVTKSMLNKDMRSRLLQGTKTVYAEWLEQGLIGADQIFDLKEATDQALDNLENPLSDWSCLESLAKVPRWCTWIQRFHTIPIPMFQKALKQILFNAVEHMVLCARVFIHAHAEAQHNISESIKPIERGGKMPRNPSANLKDAGELVISESRVQATHAKNFIMTIKRAYPEISRSIRTKMVSQSILSEKMEYVQKMRRAGLIEAREGDQLEVLISKQMKKLAFCPPQLQLPDPKALLHSHPLFSDVSRHVFETQVMPLAKPRVFNEKTEIFTVGRHANHVTIVIRGMVYVYLADGKLQRQEGTGAIVGVSEVLLSQPRARTLVAESVVEVYQIEAEAFRNLVAKHPALSQRAWQMAAAFLAALQPWGDLVGAPFELVQKHFRQCTIEEMKKGDDISVQGDVFLVQGKVMEVKLDGRKRSVKESPAPLGPGPTYYICTSEVARIARIPAFGSAQGIESISVSRMSMAALHLPTLDRLSTRMGPGGGEDEDDTDDDIGEIDSARTNLLSRGEVSLTTRSQTNGYVRLGTFNH